MKYRVYSIILTLASSKLRWTETPEFPFIPNYATLHCRYCEKILRYRSFARNVLHGQKKNGLAQSVTITLATDLPLMIHHPSTAQSLVSVVSIKEPLPKKILINGSAQKNLSRPRPCSQCHVCITRHTKNQRLTASKLFCQLPRCKPLLGNLVTKDRY